MKSQPKGRFHIRVSDQDFLNLTVWRGKSDPEAEVLVAALRRRKGDDWETIARLAVYRSSDGNYSQLPERQ